MSAILLSQYVTRIVQPSVADVLHRLEQEFTCGPVWQRQGGYFGDLYLCAAPLQEAPQGPTPRTGWPTSVGARARAILNEYTWNVESGWPTRQGNRIGIVELKAHFGATFGIPQGVPKELGPIGESKRGFLCQAIEWRLEGEYGRYFEIESRIGTLYLRPSGERRGCWLGFLLGKRTDNKTIVGQRIVHLAECGIVEQITDPYQHGSPWESLTTQDTTGRSWIVRGSSLRFSASCRLDVIGHYSRKLEREASVELHPPYEAVWSPIGSSDLVPLELR